MTNLFFAGITTPALGQSGEQSVIAGFQFGLSNAGFGVGGYVSDSLNSRWALLFELTLAPGKDEREVSFFNQFGQKSIPGKANYLLVAPLQVGLQRRVFQEKIEDNFRPFLQASAGPTVGWEYPYFNDCNGNGILDIETDCNNDGIQGEDEGERRLRFYSALPKGGVRLGVGSTVGIGAFFGSRRRGARGFRVGYAFNYFFSGVRLLERNAQDPRHFFGTPSISLFFGSLF